MKFGVLALDYDGTIAEHGRLDPAVRGAVLAVRRQDVAVILVTGRILGDLLRYLDEPGLFDAIVAENGAVLSFPGVEPTTLLGEPPPSELVGELRRRGVEVLTGQCVVEADADAAPLVLSVVRALELPLALCFNRGRLMVLPQAISKATGLCEALRSMRLSAHNAIAIGDAENDHELLRSCEVGVAVGWGSRALQRRADVVLPGRGPDAVAAYVRALAEHTMLPPPVHPRRRIELGTLPDGSPLALAMKDRNTLIVGDPKSGKSWIMGLLCEQLVLQRYCVCVIDPEGDYGSLELLPGVVVLSARDGPLQPTDVERALRYPDVSVALDLSGVADDEKRASVRSLLTLLRDLRRRTGLPHRIVVDEAHYFLNDPDALELLDHELAGYTLITYLASRLHADVLASVGSIVITRESDPAEARALSALRAPDVDAASWETTLRELPIQEAVLLPGPPGPPGTQGGLLRFRINRRLTPHVRHRRKYLHVPVAAADAFSFTVAGQPSDLSARSLSELVAQLRRAPRACIEEHARNRDFSRWVTDVFADPELGVRLREIEASRATAADLAAGIGRAVRERYADPEIAAAASRPADT